MEMFSSKEEYQQYIIDKQKAEIEAYKHYYEECLKDLKNAHAEIESLIAGQETLQKYISKQKTEIERLKNMKTKKQLGKHVIIVKRKAR